MAGTDFYEDDEDPQRIRDAIAAAEARGDTGVTAPPQWTVVVDRDVSRLVFVDNTLGHWNRRY